MSGHKETLKKTGIFSLFTSLSRFFGLARDMLKAYAFGTGPLSVAFDIAFRLPNMFRNLLAEGALSQSFIPVYEKYRHVSAEDGRRAAGALVTFLFFVLVLFVTAGIFFMDKLLPLFLHGNLASGSDPDLVNNLSRILFPYIAFASLVSIFVSLLYSHGVFWVGSSGPALMNLFLIVVFGAYIAFTGDMNIVVFSVVTLGSALLQLIFAVFYARKYSVFPRLNLNWKHPALTQLFTMMMPAVFAASVQELGQIADIFMATMITNKVPGAVSALTYAHRLIQLPIGIFGVALATASLPQLSRLFLEEKKEEFSDSIEFGTRMNLILLLPASIGLITLAEPIVGLLFEYGNFSRESTQVTAFALQFYASGILAYSLQKFYLSAMYSRQNTLFPSFVTVFVLVLNIALSLFFMRFLNHGGLALGSSVAAYTGLLFYMFFFLKKKFISIKQSFIPQLRSYSFLILINAVFYLLLQFASKLVDQQPYWQQLVLTIPGAIVFYILAVYFLKIKGLELVFDRLKSRRR